MANSSPIFMFDAYGTLFDVHAVARAHAAAIGPQAARLSELWRAKQLEYTWIYARADRRSGLVVPPFREITCASLMYALGVCGLEAGLAPLLLDSYQRLPTFAEVPAALHRLKAGGARLAILSNADTDMLDDLVAHAGIGDMFDALISVRTAGSYKPDPAVYALGPEFFGQPAADMMFVSSNRWDIAGASAFGYQTTWINRAGLPNEYDELAADRVQPDLSSL